MAGTTADMALVRPEALDEARIEDLIGQHLAHNLEILPEQVRHHPLPRCKPHIESCGCFGVPGMSLLDEAGMCRTSYQTTCGAASHSTPHLPNPPPPPQPCPRR